MSDDTDRGPVRAAPSLRPAVPADANVLVEMIGELAAFEQLGHLMQVTPEALATHLFGPRPGAEAVLAEVDGAIAGFALFFSSFSTFLGRPGLYLEDLYVRPACRSRGRAGPTLHGARREGGPRGGRAARAPRPRGPGL